ncbi:MAG: metallophosphoesterase [Anaerolineaceae bacterium]|nr:metallophosphoesterase [Anaerolineaceae bacterium]
MIPEKDFSKHKVFPGTTGNPFDVVLHWLKDYEHTPLICFVLTLIALTALGTVFSLIQHTLTRSLILFGIILIDWNLVAWLPRTGRSFGPVKPVILQLAIARCFFALIPFPLWLFVLIQLIGTAAVIYGFWIEPFQLKTTRMTLKTPKLQKGAALKILHLGDLHFERQTIRETALLQKINQLQPDLILFSGDILNLSYLHDEQAWQGARAIFEQFSAPLGVYLVTGSPAVDLEEILPDLLADLPVRLLRDEAVTIPVGGDQLTLVGSFCSHHPDQDGSALEKLTQSIEDNHSFRIFLYHTPDLAPVAARLGYDLQLSGHTHGGQVRLPFYGALFTGSLYGKQFESGLYQMNEMKLYITRGIGLEGAGAPRVRFLCPPEIILWEISSSIE